MAEYCKYAGLDYSEGSISCQEGVAYECVSGRWKDTGRHCGPESARALVSSPKIAERPAALAAACCTSYPIAGGEKVGVRNNCDVCTQAVISINYSNGTHAVKKYPIQAHSDIEIDITHFLSAQFIGEEKC
jgi:hypothetical protein